MGESAKVLRKATFATTAKEASAVGSRPATSLDCLRSSSVANDKLAEMVLKSRTKIEGKRLPNFEFKTAPDSTDLRRIKNKDKIVAKKSFFLNPHRNDPKIIRTKNRLYVI